MVLLIAGVTGFILVSPVPAHAAGPTIFLSATSGAPGTSIEITGQGFANGKAITIQSTVGTATVDWFSGAGSSGVDSLTGDCCTLIAAAAGDFNTQVSVPDMPGGAQTITVSDGTSKGTATFTITPSVKLALTGGDPDTFSTGYPEQVTTVTATVRGFAATETVTINNNGIFSSFAPALTTNAFGTASAVAAATVADSSGGKKTILATGQTSSLTASTSFTITPWVSFFNTQIGGTTFSFLGVSPSSLLIEGHGFTAGTNVIAGNSITVGGVSTTHSAITVGSDGAFGAGSTNHVVVSPNQNVPFGQAAVVIQGNTFNLANGNINQWNGVGATGPVLGGVLISSIIGTATTTAVGQLDKASYGFGDSPNALGYGFKPGDTITPNANGNLIGVTLGIATNTIEKNVVDPNGAIFVSTTVGSFGDKAAGSYTDTFTGSTTANTISPAFTVTQVLTLSFDTATGDGTGTIDFLDSGLTLSVHGFSATAAVTVTAGGATLNTGSITTDATGKALGQAVTNPDLAQGTFTATASDATYTATDMFTVTPLVAPGAGTTLTVLVGGAGTVTSLRTVTGYGVHGLKPNTIYDVNWGMVQTTGKNVIGSFTSTATGGIPLPGVQITIPPGSAGNHIISLIEHVTGNDALFNVVDTNIESEALEVFSQYGDMVFFETITAIATPTVVNVGQTFTLSGTGLFAATTYYTSITTASGFSGGQLYSQFTTDSSGSIPAGTSLVFPALPALPGPGIGTCSDGTAYPEKATSYYVHLSQASQVAGGGQDGQALVILQGSVALNATSVAAGRSVTLSGTGLCPSQAYNVIFNYATNGVTFTGQTVSAFVTNTVGSGSGVFTVPAATIPGSYVVQLQRLSPTTLLGVLNVAPTLVVVGSTVKDCNTTSCFTVSGAITKDTKGSLTGLDATFTNAATTSVTGIVYAVVHNSIGQTVYYTTATITPPASGTATAFLVLSGLPAGTYSVSVFATDTSGNAISVSTTTSVTLP